MASSTESCSRDLCTAFTLRSNRSTSIRSGSAPYNELCVVPRCRVLAFTQDGSLLTYSNGQSVRVCNASTMSLMWEVEKPRTTCLQFSPRNTFLATWEPCQVASTAGGQPDANLRLWNTATGQLHHEFVHKKQQDWCPQWSMDEAVCAMMNVNNEIWFYEDNKFDRYVNKCHLPKICNFALSPRPSPPYHIAVHVPGTKGQPSFVRLFQYPNFTAPNSALANKSFYQSEKADLSWNNKVYQGPLSRWKMDEYQRSNKLDVFKNASSPGCMILGILSTQTQFSHIGRGLHSTAVLIQTSTESSAASYYGEQGLHYIDITGQSCLVPRAKDGPVYSAVWNPNSENFCVVYGTMPAKATLYNLKCEVIFDFGTGPRNCVYYNPHGNMLCLCGFGNLRGNVEVWDLGSQRLISNPQAADTTHFEWSPDGEHFLTSTTTPRLRVGNGYKLWHYTGNELSKLLMGEGEELYEAMWRPVAPGVYPQPVVIITQAQKRATDKQQEKPAAYIPPSLRNQPQLVQKPKYREAYEPASNMKQSLANPPSKAAIKNRKKREAKAKKREQGGEGTGGDDDEEDDKETKLVDKLEQTTVKDSKNTPVATWVKLT